MGWKDREDLDMEEAAGIIVQKKVPLCNYVWLLHQYIYELIQKPLSSISYAENKKAPSLQVLFQDVQN